MVICFFGYGFSPLIPVFRAEMKEKGQMRQAVWISLRLNSKQKLGTFSIFFRSVWSVSSVWPL